MIWLSDAYSNWQWPLWLYALLGDRSPNESISHRTMPSWEEHCAFIKSRPYPCWYLIVNDEQGHPVGAIYLTERREVGIHLFREHRNKGYGVRAIEELRKMHPGPILANVNPLNADSLAFFESIGGKHIQSTLRIE